MKARTFLTIISLIVLLTLALTFGSVLILRIFALAVLLLVLGYLWSLFGVRGLSTRAKISAELGQVGERFEEEITVSSSSRIPKLMIAVEENTDLPGHRNAVVFNLSPKSSYCWQTEVYCRRRGRYSLGTVKASVTDPFGLFTLHRSLGQPHSIIVYPTTVELPLFQPLSSNNPGTGPSRWLSNEVGPNASRVREYANGDTLNRIHWRSTAHTGKLMVKEFDADTTTHTAKNVWLIADMSRAVQAGDGDDGTEECAVTLAASLTKKVIDANRSAGLIAAGDRTYLFPPEAGSDHLRKVMEALALMRAAGELPVEQLISREIERFDSDSAVVVITPSANERMASVLRQVKSRGAIVIAILIDAASFGGATGTTNVSSSLVSAGCQVYIVRHGDELARALDSRVLVSSRR